MKRLSLVMVAALLASGPAWAQELPDYRCTVQRVSESAAPMSAASLALERKTHVGASFSVDRRTGVMSGPSLATAEVLRPEVIDEGSPSAPATSFIALTVARRSDGTGRRNSLVQMLVIAEYAKSDEKPFHYVEGHFSYHGSCVHVARRP